MLKLIFAQTAPAGTYPPYVNFSGIVGSENDGIRIIVRDDAIVEHTENGSHLHAGPVATTIISREQAEELADSIHKHYADLYGNGETPSQQIDKLAQFIMENVEGEPSESEGAVDCAIRLLREASIKTGSIAKGIALGQVEQSDSPMPTGTINAALPNGRNAPSPAYGTLGRAVELPPVDQPVVATEIVESAVAHLRDHELGGRDPGDEDPYDNIPF